MKTYIIDFLNVFSDYRELKYKIMGINFHEVKYNTLLRDTDEFFKFFFTKYIKKQEISIDNSFIFVMKKLINYEKVLENILNYFKNIDIKFIIVCDKYSNIIINNNKDDFMCQYLLTIYKNSYLISNDLFRNKNEYLNIFLDLKKINCEIMTYNHKNKTLFIINKEVIDNIASLVRYSCSISKNKLLKIIKI